MDDHHSGEHNAHIGPGAHLPDPSIWPIVVGLASFLLGGALIWWARDTGSAFAGPFLGAAVVVTLVAAAGWAYEDGRMKRAAEDGGHGKPRNARFTQVITFAVPEGQFEAASAADGVIGKIDSADTALRDLAGFQDLRIVAAPAESGPSQVLVETTWSDREGLATYDETRQTVLDMVGEFEDQVVPGTVQVFDTVVVRDTKDVAVKFGMGTAATMIGGLAVFGLLIGAGLSIFEGEGGGGEGGGDGPAPPAGFQETGEITSRNIAFNVEEFSLPPETEISLVYRNLEATLHNFQVFDGADASAPFLTGCSAGCADGTDEIRTAILGLNEETEFTFTSPGPGTYFFNCALHPVEMQGTITIEEGAPIPGAGDGEPAPEEGEGTDGEGDAETDGEEEPEEGA